MIRALYIGTVLLVGLLYILAGLIFLIVGIFEEGKGLVMRLYNKKKVC